MSKDDGLLEALKNLLLEREATTQEDICASLNNKGFDVNQSKISRLLRKVGASKITNLTGHVVYSLPREPAPPSLTTELKDLIVEIKANENMIVIIVSPGSASMVARLLDYAEPTTEILGTLAGDDTIFVVPKSIKNMAKLKEEIHQLLT